VAFTVQSVTEQRDIVTGLNLIMIMKDSSMEKCIKSTCEGAYIIYIHKFFSKACKTLKYVWGEKKNS
jgi:hypothetical protein